VHRYLHTFRVDSYPVEVARQLFGDVGFASGWKPNHGDDMWTVDIVGALSCNTQAQPNQKSFTSKSERLIIFSLAMSLKTYHQSSFETDLIS
jgi:hypothetical protein